MKAQRFLHEGENIVNGFTVIINAVESAKQSTKTSRIAAKYYGTISKDGEVIVDFTKAGKTARQIKAICGVVEATPRTTSKLALLEKTKKQLEALGFATEEVAKAIEAETSRI